MAVVELNVSPETNRSKGEAIFEMKTVLTSPGTSDDYILPDGVGKITGWLLHFIISDGRGCIEITISNREDVVAGTAEWFIWDYGEVRSNQRTTLFQVSGVRVVNVDGTVTLEQKVI